MATLDYDAIKEIPGYKVIMKSVLKSLIQQLVEQLASHTEEESVILTANVSDGTLSHLGSDSGKTFLDDHEDIKSQFLGFCLKRHHRKKQDKEREEQEEAMRVAANQFSMRGQAAPHFVNRSPRLQSPRQPGIHPVSMSRATPGARGQRHEPYPLNRPRKQSETQSSPSAGPTMQLPVSGNTEIKTEPVEENNENGNENTPSQNPEDDAKLDMSSSPNEGQDIKSSETLPSGELGFDSSLVGDVSQHSDNNADTGEPNIKMEAFGDSEMDLEITGVEQGMPLAPQENWGPSTSTGFDQSGATGSPGDVQGFNASITDTDDENTNLYEAELVQDSSLEKSEDSMVNTCMEKKSKVKYEELPINLAEKSQEESKELQIKTDKRSKNECYVCNKVFKFHQSLKRHIKMHDSRYPHGCKKCTKYFETKRELDDHNERTHVKRFLCVACGKGFENKTGLNHHYLISHKAKSLGSVDSYSKVLVCPIENCKKVFIRLTKYEDHLDKHSGTKSHACSKCEKRFWDRYQRIHHEKICFGLVSATCNVCNANFKEKAALQKHINAKHEGMIHVCEDCGKTFMYAASLSRHRRAHHRTI